MKSFFARTGALILLMALSGSARAADLIPPQRLANWKPGVTVGVPGGIPTTRNHLIDVTKPPYNADKTGKNDPRAAIEAAVNAAVKEDVVFLPAGTYRVEGPINIRA